MRIEIFSVDGLVNGMRIDGVVEVSIRVREAGPLLAMLNILLRTAIESNCSKLLNRTRVADNNAQEERRKADGDVVNRTVLTSGDGYLRRRYNFFWDAKRNALRGPTFRLQPRSRVIARVLSASDGGMEFCS